MSILPEAFQGYVDNVTIVDNHFSPAIHQAIEAVARGDEGYPTLLMQLAGLRLVQLGIPNKEAELVLFYAVKKLQPRSETMYQIIDSRAGINRENYYKSLPLHVHSIARGEVHFKPTVLFHHIIADILNVGGYSSEITVNVLANGTRDLIRWRKGLAGKS